MPIYEFTCKRCSADFEALCRIGGSAEEGCPSCGSLKVTKRMSTFVGKSNGNGTDRKAAPSLAAAGGHCCGGGCRCH